MGKQTNLKGSRFGGEWTVQKLNIIEKYLNAYTIALKNQKVKKIYVDGFAGSGITELKTSGKNGKEQIITVDGSALISLKYDFDEYYFLELNEDRITLLKENVKHNFPSKANKVHFINGDCNKELSDVLGKITRYHRCVMFLDPYSLELKWETLEKISKCDGVDLWYLFPLFAIRLMAKDKDISEGNKEKVTSILGTDEWLDDLFFESPQLPLFGDPAYKRVEYSEVLKYIKDRFSSVFPYVAPSSKILKNEEKNAPMFMLCFMMTNKSIKAQKLASNIVKDIIDSTEKL